MHRVWCGPPDVRWQLSESNWGTDILNSRGISYLHRNQPRQTRVDVITTAADLDNLDRYPRKQVNSSLLPTSYVGSTRAFVCVWILVLMPGKTGHAEHRVYFLHTHKHTHDAGVYPCPRQLLLWRRPDMQRSGRDIGVQEGESWEEEEPFGCIQNA